MHTIEPFYLWRDLYIASEDKLSPFYQKEYNEFEFTHSVYNYLIHPQWDEIGSSTLYIKILYANYEAGYCIIELIGEWNDCLHNDIMYLKRNIADYLIPKGINKFILIGEHVFNYHASDDCYYQEWAEDIENGWIVALNFRKHVLDEFKTANINYYIEFIKAFDNFDWQIYTPMQLFQSIDNYLTKRINA